MTTATPPTQMKAARQRQLAELWRAGMVLLAVGVFSDTAGQVWNNLGTPGWTLQAHALAAAPALLGGAAGLALTSYAALNFQKGPLPRFVVYGTSRNMDEREVTQLMEAQAEAQRHFARGILILMLLFSGVARHGVYLSWWSCLLGSCLLLNAVIYLPIVLLAWSEPDLGEEA